MVTPICRSTCWFIWLTAVPSAPTVAGVLKSKIAMKSSWLKYCSGSSPQRDIRA
ncbi:MULTISPECIES: hypothetical protein [Eubacteriales]|uniref:hypothetical protein n=1 Tax=Eubacteriales TaxID=186802 RepID=UPI0019593FDB|nr:MULTISPECIES: hypothetical protein [Eubacteriales]MBM6871582.1 hypothetical protein [Pseudoflavonifractor phocaeensis]